MTFDLFGFNFSKNMFGIWFSQVSFDDDDSEIDPIKSLFAFYYENGNIYIDLFFLPLIEFTIYEE